MPYPEIETTATLALLYSRVDPATIFAWIVSVLGIQALMWGIARDSTDIEWWRAALLSTLVTGISFFVLAVVGTGDDGGLPVGPIIGAAFATAFAVWIVGGMLYDPEVWQRAVLAAASPVIGVIAWILGLLLRNAIIPAP